MQACSTMCRHAAECLKNRNAWMLELTGSRKLSSFQGPSCQLAFMSLLSWQWFFCPPSPAPGAFFPLAHPPRNASGCVPFSIAILHSPSVLWTNIALLPSCPSLPHKWSQLRFWSEVLVDCSVLVADASVNNRIITCAETCATHLKQGKMCSPCQRGRIHKWVGQCCRDTHSLMQMLTSLVLVLKSYMETPGPVGAIGAANNHWIWSENGTGMWKQVAWGIMSLFSGVIPGTIG